MKVPVYPAATTLHIILKLLTFMWPSEIMNIFYGCKLLVFSFNIQPYGFSKYRRIELLVTFLLFHFEIYF